MTRSEFDQIAILYQALWPWNRQMPDFRQAQGQKPDRVSEEALVVWWMRLSSYPKATVEKVLREIADRDDKAPSWPRLKEKLGISPTAIRELRDCAACHGLGVAHVILPEFSVDKPAYSGVTKCICEGGPKSDELRRQIEDRMDRARNLGIRYAHMFSRDEEAFVKAHRQDFVADVEGK